MIALSENHLNFLVLCSGSHKDTGATTQSNVSSPTNVLKELIFRHHHIERSHHRVIHTIGYPQFDFFHF